MGMGTPGWNESTFRPQGQVEIEQEPDGGFHAHWRWDNLELNVLLDLEQVRQLNAEALNASLLAHEPARVEE